MSEKEKPSQSTIDQNSSIVPVQEASTEPVASIQTASVLTPKHRRTVGREFLLPLFTSVIAGLVLEVLFTVVRFLACDIKESFRFLIGQFAIPSFFLNAALVILLFSLIRALTNRLSLACLLTSGIWGIFFFAHVQKFKVLGKPLALSDLFILNEFFKVSGSVIAGHGKMVVAVVVSVLLVVGLCVFLIRKKPAFPLTVPARILLLALCILPFATEGIFGWQKGFLKRLEVRHNDHNYRVSLRTNGFALTLMLMAQKSTIPRPENYDPRTLQEAMAQVTQKALTTGAKQGLSEEAHREAPDVVVYMGEAFWDLTQLKDVQFSQDPFPNFHRIAQDPQTQMFTMTSPTYGGGTANVEFEALTGFPMSFFPEASIPYSLYLRMSIPDSTPATFRAHGYETKAIHNYYGFFFSRMIVYPLLGFDDFIPLAQLDRVDLNGQNPGKRVNKRGLCNLDGVESFCDGLYASDEPLVWRINKELNDASNQKPKFLFAISMTGHGPYLFERFPQPDVTILNRSSQEKFDETLDQELENVATAMFRADKSIGWLFDRLKERKRPTLFVLFGDHLPGLSSGAYESGGFDFGEELHRMYEIRAVVWANYPLPKFDSDEAFSTFYLAPKILRAAGLNLPPRLGLVESMEKTIPVLSPGRFRTTEGKWLNNPNVPEVSPAQKDAVQLLQAMTYETFGK